MTRRVASAILSAGHCILHREERRMDEITQRIRHMLATRLKLDDAIREITDDTPLFAPEGARLDSIDALEVVLGLEKEFGVIIDDRAVAIRVLTSIRTMAEYVQSQQKG